MFFHFRIILLFSFLILQPLCFKISASQSIVVTGLGYPPIKAVTEAQALAMARRAAILDAYSKIVWRQQSTSVEKVKEATYFLHFSGFVQNMEITQEKLLSDGGVLLTVRSIAPLNMQKRNEPILKKQNSNKKRVTSTTPKQISKTQWFEIISNSVQTGKK